MSHTHKQELVSTLDVTGEDNNDGTGTIAIQAKDSIGANLSKHFLVRLWTGATDFGIPEARGTLSITTGTLLRTLTANADCEVLSNNAGLIVMTVSVDPQQCPKWVYVMAEINGRVYSVGIEITY